jgi:hypothetical protein
MSDNPDQNMTNEKFCSQFSTYTYFKKTHGILRVRGIRARGLSDCVEGSWTD